MNATFDSGVAMFLIAWLAIGGFAVFTFLRQARRTMWHWVSLIIGVGILAGGVLSAWIHLSSRQ
jgi:hypothetical protein